GARYSAVRRRTIDLALPLEPEDSVIQTADFVSPPKWHLAHTSWFFENFILKTFDEGYKPFDSAFDFLFNSYYLGVGEFHARARRGILSRPTLGRIMEYRRSIDAAMERLLARADAAVPEKLSFLVALGLAHEEQHQELFLMDV